MKIWYNDLKLRVVIVLQARPIYIVAMRADFLYNGVNRSFFCLYVSNGVLGVGESRDNSKDFKQQCCNCEK